MLSKRLLTIAKLVDKNKVVYDVGSDHGLLPCFLLTNNICPKVYAVDNKKGPLDKAKENARRFNVEDRMICKLSSGIEDIENDVNIITIAGMGFYTVKEILEGKDLSKYDKLIVQVNKDVDGLRRWISDNNYTILDEEVVFEDHYYEIVVFNTKEYKKLSEEEIIFGPINLKKKSKTFKDYLEYKLKKCEKVYEKSQSQKAFFEIERLNVIIGTIAEE